MIYVINQMISGSQTAETGKTAEKRSMTKKGHQKFWALTFFPKKVIQKNLIGGNFPPPPNSAPGLRPWEREGRNSK